MPSARRHSVFHPLRVASIERLTDDAVAITFDVPPELLDQFRF
ncbi:MAG TPA: phenylacetic acid degradation protein, partial [Streptosporangiaceae bacterium]|nr:phenylacetic acid degradation protein [Streptosporangiaceae bacterium]